MVRKGLSPSAKKGEYTRGSNMKQDVGERLEISQLEWWRRAQTDGDLQAWAASQQGLQETVLSWFHDHPCREAACRLHSERHFVALAFERLQQALSQRPGTCQTLSEVLAYLRACLNGVILEALRVCKWPEGVPSPWPDGEDACDRSQVWERLQALLSNERERRLAYLLYHCGLTPAEIVRGSPQEWGDIQEVARLRRIILARLMRGLICEEQPFV
jgi:hypothetical protein